MLQYYAKISNGTDELNGKYNILVTNDAATTGELPFMCTKSECPFRTLDLDIMVRMLAMNEDERAMTNGGALPTCGGAHECSKLSGSPVAMINKSLLAALLIRSVPTAGGDLGPRDLGPRDLGPRRLCLPLCQYLPVHLCCACVM